MNRLDEFFKKKLEERSFPFQETDWLAAQKLIEEEERKKRAVPPPPFYKGKKGYLLLLLILGLSAVLGYWMRKGDGETLESSLQETESVILKNTKESASNNDLNTPAVAAQDSLSSKSDATTTEELSALNLTSVQKTINPSPQNDPSTISQKPKSHSNTPTDIPKTDQNSRVPPVNDFSLSSERSPAGSASVPQSDAAASGNLDASDPVQQAKPNPSDAQEKGIEQAEPDPFIAQEKVEGQEVLAINRRMGSFANLEGKNFWAQPSAAQELDFPEAPTLSPIVFDSRNKPRYAIGLYAGTWNNLSIGGYQAGLSLQYAIGKHFALESGLGYRTLGGDLPFIQDATDISFSFGRREDYRFLFTSRLHYLELPLRLRYRFGRHSINPGLTFAYLTGVQGIITETEQDLVEGVGTLQWIEPNSAHKLQYQLQLSYAFALTNRLEVAIQGGYFMRPVFIPEELPNDLEFISGNELIDVSQPNIPRAYVQIGVQYWLYQPKESTKRD